METPLAVVYQRVSTDRQDNSRQLVDITDYCQKENIKIIKTFEEKISGKIRTRPELTNLLNFVRTNSDNVKYCIFSEVSRLGRTTRGVLEFLEELNALKICSIFINDGKRTLKEDGSVDGDVMMLLTIMSGINARELDSISYKVKSGLQNSALKGNIGGGIFPYGYTKLSKDNKLMVVQPDEAEIVRIIFNMSLNNISTVGIARYLNSQNIKSRKLIKWKNSSIYRILTNKLYTGVREHKRTIYKDAKTGIKTFESTFYNCPAIVDKSIFEQVQINLKNRSSNGGGKMTHEYLLNNKKLICGCCGMYYYPHFREKKTSYYECGSTLNGNDNCGNGLFAIEKLEALVTDIISSKFPTMITKYANVQDFENDLIKLDSDLSGYKEYLLKEKKKEDTLLDLNIEGNITKEQFINKVTPIRNEISNIEAKIKTIQEQIKRTEELKANKLDISKILLNWGTDGSDKSLLKKIISSVTITKATDEEQIDRSAEPEEIPEVTNPIPKEPFSGVELCNWKNNTNYRLDIVVAGLAYTVYCAQRSNRYYFNGRYYEYQIK